MCLCMKLAFHLPFQNFLDQFGVIKPSYPPRTIFFSFLKKMANNDSSLLVEDLVLGNPLVPRGTVDVGEDSPKLFIS